MMSMTEHAARDLFETEGRQTRNIRFYFQGEQRSADQLSDYRTRALAQIGVTAHEDVDFDRQVLD